MKISKKTIVFIFIFVITLFAFYLVFAFMVWNIIWVKDELWFLRVLFSTICIPLSLAIATEFSKDK